MSFCEGPRDEEAVVDLSKVTLELLLKYHFNSNCYNMTIDAKVLKIDYYIDAKD